ncbi:MAG TPA: hypothetical protein VFI73_04370 [Candidatus Nitrosopolaris sp.]|nr:hypothetical protein [Candidatus Nitrosopolaris sp.]
MAAQVTLTSGHRLYLGIQYYSNMRLKLIYAAGVGIVAIVLAIFIISSTSHSNNSAVPTNATALPLTLSINDIVPNEINNHSATIQVSFNATNPNKATAILEAIAYDILVDGKRIVSGTIGTRLEGFVTSSAGIYPIVGYGSVILKDDQLFQKNNSTTTAWNKVIEGKANYVVTGTMSYRQISSLQASSTDRNFRLAFH